LLALFSLFALPSWAVGSISALVARDAFRVSASLRADRLRGWAFLLMPLDPAVRDAQSVIPMSGRALLRIKGRARLGPKVPVRWTGNSSSDGSEPLRSEEPTHRLLSSSEIEELQLHARDSSAATRNPGLWYFTMLVVGWLFLSAVGRPPTSPGVRLLLALLSAAVVIGHLSARQGRRLAKALRRDAELGFVERTRSTEGRLVETLASASLVWTVDGRPASARTGLVTEQRID
jgi:hypothetical protein